MPFVRAWALNLQRFRRRKKPGLGLGRVRCDGQGSVYVVDGENGVVYKLDGDGTLLATLSGDTSVDRLRQPRDVAVDASGNVFVSDLGGKPGPPRIVQFDNRGRPNDAFSLVAPAEAVAVDSVGFLYVHMPSSEWRIQKLTRNGNHVMSFGPRPKEGEPRATTGRRERVPGVFELLSSIGVDSRDRVYFSPAWTYDVCQFTAGGKVRRHFSQQLRHQQPYPGSVSSDRTPWNVVVSDISIPLGKDEVYLLRTQPANGGALVDLWSSQGEEPEGVRLDGRGYSIALDLDRNLYLLYSNVTERKVELVKYIREP